MTARLPHHTVGTPSQFITVSQHPAQHLAHGKPSGTLCVNRKVVYMVAQGLDSTEEVCWRLY